MQHPCITLRVHHCKGEPPLSNYVQHVIMTSPDSLLLALSAHSPSLADVVGLLIQHDASSSCLLTAFQVREREGFQRLRFCF